jgi:hypothetical protein
LEQGRESTEALKASAAAMEQTLHVRLKFVQTFFAQEAKKYGFASSNELNEN